MKKMFLLGLAMPFIFTMFWSCSGLTSREGEEAFIRHCSTCHAGGGNAINPARTLSRKDLGANGIKTPADIVARMRKPGPQMPKFDEVEIPDKTADAIAEYILKTFK